MAITLADFNKIWASTSPLTPYSFSESNYKQGWNFIGSTPPARQMWDFLQKNNDEKMQYLANNYLPLSGGTMTGDIAFNGSEKWVKKSTFDGALCLGGGTSFVQGGSISLFGKTHGTWGGSFWIVAHDGTNEKRLVGKPDGTLTWGGINVATENKFSRRYSFDAGSTAGGSLTVPPGQYLLIVSAIGYGVPSEAHYVGLLGVGANVGTVDIKKGNNYSTLGLTITKSGSNCVISFTSQYTYISAFRLC